MPGRPVDRRVVAVGVVIPVLVVVVILALQLGGTDDSDPASETTAQTDPPASTRPASADDDRWNEEVGRALAPLEDVLLRLAAGVDEWSRGERTDEELRELLGDVGPTLAGVRGTVEDLEPHASEPLAHLLVTHMAELYGHAVEAHELALGSADPGVSRQFDLLGRRLRILGDRVFDRARERTSAPLESTPQIRIELPAEVPDWTRLELAAGPPLEPEDGNRPDDLPLGREDERRSQDEESWIARLTDLDVPTSADVAAARPDPEALGALARRLVAAAETLRSVPVPEGDRGRADRVALGWLIRADGARAGQLSTLAVEGRPGADALADALLVMSDSAVLAVD